MLLPDVNVLIYAHFENIVAEQAEYARWLTRLATGSEPFALSVLVLTGFVRIATNPRIFDPPSTLENAFAFVSSLVERPTARIAGPVPDHLEIFERLRREAGATGKLVADAQHAAIAVEHGCTLVSTDSDFNRFAEVRWHHPWRLDNRQVRSTRWVRRIDNDIACPAKPGNQACERSEQSARSRNLSHRTPSCNNPPDHAGTRCPWASGRDGTLVRGHSGVAVKRPPLNWHARRFPQQEVESSLCLGRAIQRREAIARSCHGPVHVVAHIFVRRVAMRIEVPRLARPRFHHRVEEVP